MAQLIYSMSCSIDGFVADAHGRFDWAEPSAQVHEFFTQISRGIGTYLLGRGMYEVMSVWDSRPDGPEVPDYIGEFARLWRASEKVVYSSTLTQVAGARTRLVREFDPAQVSALVAGSPHDVAIAGPTLAGVALGSGIVNRVQAMVVPVAVGGGLPMLPRGLRIPLELVERRVFDSGAVFLDYRMV